MVILQDPQFDMSSHPHLQLFDLVQGARDEDSGFAELATNVATLPEAGRDIRGYFWHRLSFPLFPLLPQELRLKIWQHALQRNRIIVLRLESLRGQPAS